MVCDLTCLNDKLSYHHTLLITDCTFAAFISKCVRVEPLTWSLDVECLDDHISQTYFLVIILVKLSYLTQLVKVKYEVTENIHT
jgi:hypothetical protein